MTEPREATPDPFRVWVDAWNQTSERWRETLGGLAGEPGAWSHAAGAGVSRELLEKLGQGWQLHQQVGQAFLDALTAAQRQGAASFEDAWKAAGTERLVDLLREPLVRWAELCAALPVGGAAAALMGGVQTYAETMRGLGERLGAPWAEAAGDLWGAWQRALHGDPEAFRRFVSRWKTAYDASLKQLLAAPPLGLAREPLERLLQGVDAYVDFLTELHAFFGLLDRVGRQAAEACSQQVLELARAGTLPDHRALYRLYLATYEEAYDAVFRSPEYGQLQGRVLESGLRFKQRWDRSLEDVLAGFPVPTRREMTDLYEAFHALRRQVRDQERRLAALEARGERPPGGRR
jgi:hypothetical protein